VSRFIWYFLFCNVIYANKQPDNDGYYACDDEDFLAAERGERNTNSARFEKKIGAQKITCSFGVLVPANGVNWANTLAKCT
jgi:hypothetical protein